MGSGASERKQIDCGTGGKKAQWSREQRDKEKKKQNCQKLFGHPCPGGMKTDSDLDVRSSELVVMRK